MLKDLVRHYGKEKINSLTKYPSILTLHQLGDKGRLKPELTTPLDGEQLYATEKIDGTNARIVCYGQEYLFGAREFILHHSDDLYFDNAQGIVQGLKDLGIKPPQTDKLTVIYGEFYGGKTSANAKQYGQDAQGFRVFDVAVYEDLGILEQDLAAISHWRETETAEGIRYGQNFLTRQAVEAQFPGFDLVPLIEFSLEDYAHAAVLAKLKAALPQTQVALSAQALKKPEGLVLRNANRRKIVKIRFEDYERTLR